MTKSSSRPGPGSSARAPKDRAQVAQQMSRAIGAVTSSTLVRMEAEMPWFSDLAAEHRAWIGSVLEAGFQSFVAWYRDPRDTPPPLTTQVFGNAPRSFTGVISLQQTVAMIRLSIDVAETELAGAVSPEHSTEVRNNILRYGRELAFATADVYAHAAEMRGAWDARLEALLVDSVMRGETDETIRTRASALGWMDRDGVTVVLGRAPEDDQTRSSVVDAVRGAAHHAGMDALGSVQGDRLVVVLGGVEDPDKAGALLSSHFGDGPIVVGPIVADLLQAHRSAAEAIGGLRAAPGWPHAPGPVTSDDLLAERALNGDELARTILVEEVYGALQQAPDLLHTLTTYFDHGGSIEATARALYVHPNTVRYRLGRVLELTGAAPGDARNAFTLRIAVVLGRLRSPDSAL